MSPPVNSLRLQVSLRQPLNNTTIRSALCCVLLAALWAPFSAQTTITGLPQVGNGTSTPSSSQMLIDATQFVSGIDMCANIALACAQVGTTGYPLGATIDARGFTGNQVCKAINITTMLNGCS